MAAKPAASSIPANRARARFADLIGRAQHGKERLVIARHGKPAAALVPMEDLRRLEAIEDARDAAAARRALKAFQRSGQRAIPWAEAKKRLDL